MPNTPRTPIPMRLDNKANFGRLKDTRLYEDAVYTKFPQVEVTRRYTAVREKMARMGLEALIVTGGPSRFAGRVAAVTGAGSGIGRALARQLAARGAHLALSDIDEAGLHDTVTACQGLGVKVPAARVDVADRRAVHAWADAVADEHGAVHLVFNNAGVAVAATVDALSYDDLRWLIDIDFWGVVHGTKAFLPHLRASGDGHVVNISSVFGLISVPSQAAYNAAKFAVRGFTDTLRMELAIEGAPVRCTTVFPGGIKTNIARSARVDPSVAALGQDPDEARDGFDRVALTTPDGAARAILRGVERGRARVLVGPDAAVIDLLARLPGSLAERVLVAGARRRRRALA